MPLFDAYLIVDWSARSRPAPPGAPDSIWSAIVERTGRGLRTGDARWTRTRQAAAAWVHDRLVALVRDRRRVLVGFDFCYGYPRGLDAALGHPGPAEDAWRRTWDMLGARILDGEDQRNNRVDVAAALNRDLGAPPGPFWGTGTGADHPGGVLRRTRAHTFPFRTASGVVLAQWRETERRQRARGGRVSSAWQLFGAGSVGGQSLLGIPYVARLRSAAELATVSAVWPFETGFTPDPLPGRPAVVHAEVYPSTVPLPSVRHRVRDAAQVQALAGHLAELDDRGVLGVWFAVPGLDVQARRAAVTEEGWILGTR